MTVITFSTRQFDLASERKPEINPIFGHSLGDMLRREFRSLGHEVDDTVEEEDWGWYFYTTIEGQSYMVGTSADRDIEPETEEPIASSNPIPYTVQFHKKRKFIEMILGRNKLTPDDQIYAIAENILHQHIKDISDFSIGQ